MTFSGTLFNLKKALSSFDWKLLLFLLLFLNVKLSVKVPAIIIIYLLQFNFKFGFNLKNSRIPIFYLAIILIAFTGLLINGNFADINYLLVFFTGIGFWVLCILAIHQVKLSVEKNEVETIHKTILVFFVINTIISVYTLGHIMWETGVINPYQYQGERQKYFIGTGDFIKGITFDTSTTNSILNAFGVIYFLARKNAAMLFTCMGVLLITGSNTINIALLVILFILFVFKSSRAQKSYMVICLMLLVVFMAKISPQNNQYAGEVFKNTIHPQKLPEGNISTVQKIQIPVAPTAEEIKRKNAKRYLDSIWYSSHKPNAPVKFLQTQQILKTDEGHIYIEKPDIDQLAYQMATDTTVEQHRLFPFIDNHKASLQLSRLKTFEPALPGKAIGAIQTVKFLTHHPVKILAGDGVGNFSSKLAFRASGLGMAGEFPAKYLYINNDFLINHLDLYLYFFSQKPWFHSLRNNPFSVYDQIIGEYGIAGLFAFAIGYIGFFAKRLKTFSYGLPLLLLMTGLFFIDYWFEQLSVVVFFELLLLLNIKETTPKPTLSYGHS